MQKTRMPRLLLFSILMLSSCVDFKNEYAPARSRRPDTGPDPRGLKAFVEVKDGASLAHFAWGVSLSAFDGEKRKIEPIAALRFNVPPPGPWRLSLDFVSGSAQEVNFSVNGSRLGSAKVEAGAKSHVEIPVPAQLLVADTATLLGIESTDGLSLLRAGFLK